MKILHLSLNEAPFEVMVTGEKKLEFRNNSEWIKSRIVKQYDAIKFTNGYGSDRPYFIVECRNEYWIKQKASTFSYSNGLVVEVTAGMLVIKLGDVIETGNMERFKLRIKPNGRNEKSFIELS